MAKEIGAVIQNVKAETCAHALSLVGQSLQFVCGTPVERCNDVYFFIFQKADAIHGKPEITLDTANQIVRDLHAVDGNCHFRDGGIVDFPAKFLEQKAVGLESYALELGHVRFLHDFE